MNRNFAKWTIVALLIASAPAENTTVKVKVRAALYDRDLNLKPVPNLTLKIVPSLPSTGSPVNVQTTLDGIAEVELPAGKYRVITDKPIELFDKSFLWDFEVEFNRPENSLELSNANAKTNPIAGGRGARIDELAYQYKRVKKSVVTVWTDRGAVDGLVLDASGLVLTTQKPLEKTNWLAVQFDDQRRLPAVPLASDKDKDVTVLRVNPVEAGAINAAELSNDPGALVEGERVFVVENPGKEDSQKLTTGVLSKADQKEIVSDVKLTYPGAVLFNSSGAVVGIIQANGRELHISPIAVTQSTIQEARQKLASVVAPSSHLLPTPPTDDFPGDQLHAPGRGSWEKDVYSFKAGDFNVELVDPISSYESDNERYQRAMKDYAKHPKGKSEPAEPEHKYRPVLVILAVPQTKTSWGNTILSGMAAGPYSTSPTYKHYKTGFKKMRVLCGETEVEPIWPGRFVAGGHFDYSLVIEDEAFSGQYLYAHNAISPQCSKVTLQLFSTSDPDHPIEKTIDEKTVARIWGDFEPYRKGHEVVESRASEK
jgi:hypothetical protein